MAVKPISPKEAVASHENFPDEVIEAFNELIVKNMRGGSSVVKQKDVVELIAKNMMISQHAVFEHGYLDIEAVFRQAGWVVIYDKPAYNENYEAHFTFRYIEAK